MNIEQCLFGQRVHKEKIINFTNKVTISTMRDCFAILFRILRAEVCCAIEALWSAFFGSSLVNHSHQRRLPPATPITALRLSAGRHRFSMKIILIFIHFNHYIDHYKHIEAIIVTMHSLRRTALLNKSILLL